MDSTIANLLAAALGQIGPLIALYNTMKAENRTTFTAEEWATVDAAFNAADMAALRAEALALAEGR